MDKNKKKARDSKLMNILPLTSWDMILIDGYIWFSALGFNGLCRSEVRTGETEIVGRFLGEDLKKIYLHSCMGHYEGKLIFAPSFSNGIDIYDINSGKFDRIALPDECAMYNRHTKTCSIQQLENKFVMLGSFMPVIIYYDALTGSMDYIHNMGERLYGKLYNREIGVFRATTCRVGQYMYALCVQSGDIIEIDMLNNGKYEVHQINDEMFDTICHDGDRFWLSADNNIYIVKDWKVEKVVSVEEDYKFSRCKAIGSFIYYMSNEKKELVVVHRENYNVKKLVLPEEENVILVNDGYIRMHNGIYEDHSTKKGIVFGNKSNNIFFIEDGQVKKTSMLFLKEYDTELEDVTRHLLQERMGSEIVYERNLEIWLCYLTEMDYYYKKSSLKYERYGEKIHQNIVETLRSGGLESVQRD